MATTVTEPQATPLDVRRENEQTAAPQYPNWPDWCKATRKRLSMEQDGSWRERHAKALTNELMYRGMQQGRVSTQDLQFRPVRVGPKEPFPIKTYNFIRPNSDSISAQWCLSRSDLRVVPIPKHEADDDAKGKAQAANHVLDYYEDETETETFLIREDKLGQFSGNMIRKLRWDPHAGPIILHPQYEDQETKVGPDAFQCNYCPEGGSSGPAEAAIPNPQDPTSVMCPNCGNPAEIQESPTVMAPTFTGHVERRAGDIKTDIIPGYQVRFDPLAADLESANWVRIEFRMRDEEIKALIPWRVGGQSDMRSAGTGTQVEQQLQAATGTSNRGTTNVNDGVGGIKATQVELWWFKRCMYQDVTSPREEQFGDPQRPTVVPANTKYGDVWQKGLYIFFVGDEPYDFKDEDFTERVFHTQRYPVPSSGWGDGNEDVNDPQRGINLKRALKEANIRFGVGSGMISRGRYLKGGAPHGIPFERIVVEPTWPKEMPLTGPLGVVTGIERQQLPAEVYRSEDEDRQFIQYLMKTFPSSIGVADTSGGGTATEASLNNQAARNQRAVELAPYAAYRARWGKAVLTMFKENAGAKRCLPLQGKTGALNMKWFMGEDIDGQFVISARPRSWIPRGEIEYQSDIKMAFEVVAAIGGLPIVLQAPKLREQIEEAFNVSLSADNSDVAQKYCQYQLDLMKKAVESAIQQAAQITVQMASLQPVPGAMPPGATPVSPDGQDQGVVEPPGGGGASPAMGQQMSQGAPPPQMQGAQDPVDMLEQQAMPVAVQIILAAAPIMPTVQNHPICIAYIQTYLQEDEGIRAPEAFKQALIARIEEHKMAMQSQMMQSAANEVAVGGPARDAEAGAARGEADSKQDVENDKQDHQRRLAKDKGQTQVELAHIRSDALKGRQQGGS